MDNAKNPKVEFYFDKAGQWQEPLAALRTVVLDCGLTEELKWGTPCYTFQKSNVALLHYFKEYCAILFPKGALLQDTAGLLIQQTENTQAHRQLRFTSARQVAELASTLKAYVFEAIEVEKAGLKVAHKETAEFDVPEEFQQQLTESPALQEAFAALTPGRQRAYLLYFAAPNQATTRAAREAKYMPAILDGQGLHD